MHFFSGEIHFQLLHALISPSSLRMTLNVLPPLGMSWRETRFKLSHPAHHKSTYKRFGSFEFFPIAWKRLKQFCQSENEMSKKYWIWLILESQTFLDWRIERLKIQRVANKLFILFCVAMISIFRFQWEPTGLLYFVFAHPVYTIHLFFLWFRVRFN